MTSGRGSLDAWYDDVMRVRGGLLPFISQTCASTPSRAIGTGPTYVHIRVCARGARVRCLHSIACAACARLSLHLRGELCAENRVLFIHTQPPLRRR